VQTLQAKPKPLALGPGKLSRLESRKELVQAGGFFFLVSVVAMFLIDGGLENIVDLPSALDAVSRITSLLGTAILLIMLLLTARIPWIDAQFGQDRATHTHKRLGKPAFYLILGHFAASLLSYALTDGRDLASELWYLVTTFEDFLTATISLVAMIAVVVSSLTFARKRLKYESWYLTHLLSYATVILAIPHIFNMGTDLVMNQVHNAVWMFAYVFVGYNILTFRVLLPLWRSLAAGVKVERVNRESGDAVSIYLTGRRLDRFAAKPGQFFHVRFLTKSLWAQAHPFSISSVPRDRSIRFTIADRGDGSNLMQKVKPGTRVILSGPFGVFTEDKRTQRDVVLIAAGIGIPPVRALAEGMRSTPSDISILYRTRNIDDAPLLDELAELSELKGHNLVVVDGSRPANDNWLSHTHLSDKQHLLQLFPRIQSADVYVCGPIEFTSRAQQTLKGLGLKPSQIHSEEYAW
jgi:predicted ferric reductase